MYCLEHAAQRYYRDPRLESTSDGGALLSAILWEGARECVVRLALAADGTPKADVILSEHADAIMGWQPGAAPRVSNDVPCDDVATLDGWQVSVEREGSRSRVVAQTKNGKRCVVWQAHAIAAAPTLAPVPNGAWIAFHHDLREDTGAADVAKWIALRFVNAEGQVFQPAAQMPDLDRDATGEQQSFEFPSLMVGADGAVAIFGRGSHNFYRQTLNANGFEARQALSDGAWGCRGRRIALTRLRDGATLSARREKKGIVVERFSAPSGGAPPLEPATVESGRVSVTSAYVLSPRPSWKGPRVLFGDLHQHSAHSDGIGTADEPYLRARHRYDDDFTALTDHESFLGKRIGPGEWKYLQEVAERHNEPGTFATLFAYEWTARMHPGPGHKCIYFDTPGASVLSRDDVTEGAELLRKLKEEGGIAAPHHIGWTGADAAAHDPVTQPIWEMCSCHGCYECADHPLGQRGELRDQMVCDMLNRGLRFGLIASSDSHGLLWHHGVARQRDPFRTGLTAVLSEDCTRQGVMQALRQRRCYATSGAKILIDLQANQQPMGSEIKNKSAIHIASRIQGTAPLARLEWIGPEGVMQSTGCASLTAQSEIQTSARWSYLRVTQSDGQMAWTSPVFLSS